jgi:hypothetical protein
MSDVAVFVNLDRTPGRFFGLDLVGAMTHVSRPLDVVENEEFVFRPEVRDIGDSGRLQVSLGTLGDGAWVTR